MLLRCQVEGAPSGFHVSNHPNLTVMHQPSFSALKTGRCVELEQPFLAFAAKQGASDLLSLEEKGRRRYFGNKLHLSHLHEDRYFLSMRRCR